MGLLLEVPYQHIMECGHASSTPVCSAAAHVDDRHCASSHSERARAAPSIGAPFRYLCVVVVGLGASVFAQAPTTSPTTNPTAAPTSTPTTSPSAAPSGAPSTSAPTPLALGDGDYTPWWQIIIVVAVIVTFFLCMGYISLRPSANGTKEGDDATVRCAFKLLINSVSLSLSLSLSRQSNYWSVRCCHQCSVVTRESKVQV